MARCGCGGAGCACFVEAGTGTTVVGTGSSTNPFVVSVGTPDCSLIRPCISAGNGAAYSSASGVVSARLSTDAGNLAEFGSDGGLFVETDCATVRACLSEGDGIDYDPVTGEIKARPSTDVGNTLEFGGDGGLFVPGGAVDCATVRGCISAGNGAAYVPATGVVSARPSTDAGNTLVFGGDTGLYVPPPTVNTGCGINGDGSVGDPLVAAVGAWPYACDLEDNGGLVVCGGDGILRGEPRAHSAMQSMFFDQDFANIVVPATRNNLVATLGGDFTNPDPCRPAIAIAMQEMEFELNLPAQAGAEYGFDGPDEMVYHINRGSAAENGFHIQVTKCVNRGVVAPGATVTFDFDALIGRGTNGATYSHLQGILRILFITQ